MRFASSVIILAVALVFVGCSQTASRHASMSPDGKCRLVLGDHFSSFLTFDPRLTVSVECGKKKTVIFTGLRDWRFRTAQVLWANDSTSACIIACSHISPPVFFTYNVTDGRVADRGAPMESLRRQMSDRFGGVRPVGCRTSTDPLLWGCCDPA